MVGISMLWLASEQSIRRSVQSAMKIVDEHGFESVAFPIIDAGSGRFLQEKVLAIMQDEFAMLESRARVIVVEYEKS